VVDLGPHGLTSKMGQLLFSTPLSYWVTILERPFYLV
jgi:hypothetical protein